ncbi:MAG: beta-phosphoglucomutase [Streptococcaceae bacterium]|nr:beta-phosphoglucomutase [Streptococcaceae bacterium]
MLKAVIFDLDGVITDTAEYHYRAWKRLGKEIEITIDREFNESLKGVSREESLNRILAFANKENQFTQSELITLTQRKNSYYEQMIEQITPKDIFPGILQLLEELKKSDIKIALGSASKNGTTLLKKMDILPYFDTIIDPAQVKNSKPAPDIFLTALEQLCLKNNQVIGIEDSLAGIKAFQAANILPIGIGEAKSLGEDIILVKDTNEISLDFLNEVWENTNK